MAVVHHCELVALGMPTKAWRACIFAVMTTIAAEAIAPPDGCVVLTGANGFLAGYIAEVLLEKGYTVHGTVRPSTMKKKHKIQHLYDMDDRLPGTLKLFPAELSRGDLDEASKACSSILATAFPIPQGYADKNSTDPAFFKYQVDAGAEGSYAAMEAAQKFGMKKVIVTSSVFANCPSKAKRYFKFGDTPYDENDWNDVASLGYLNYNYAKTLAEKAAYDWNEQNGKPVELASISFPYGVANPKHKETFSSLGMFSMVLGGDLGLFYFPVVMHVVHMRDVARAHVHVLEHSKGQGRYIVSPPPAKSYYPISHVSALYRKKFPEYPVAFMPIPAWALKFFPNGAAEFTEACGNGFDGTKITRELGFEYEHLDMEAAIVQLGEALIAAGIVEKGRIRYERFVIGFAILMLSLVFCCRKCCGSKSKAE